MLRAILESPRQIKIIKIKPFYQVIIELISPFWLRNPIDLVVKVILIKHYIFIYLFIFESLILTVYINFINKWC